MSRAFCAVKKAPIAHQTRVNWPLFEHLFPFVSIVKGEYDEAAAALNRPRAFSGCFPGTKKVGGYESSIPLTCVVVFPYLDLFELSDCSATGRSFLAASGSNRPETNPRRPPSLKTSCLVTRKF